MTIARLTAIALACCAMASAEAEELAPGNGYSIRLAGFDGTVYYTVEQDGYRVVATLASGADEPPIRFISTLAPGQGNIISIAQSLDQPSADLEIARSGDRLSDSSSSATVHVLRLTATKAANRE
jgi:hypothetical protein